MITGILLGDGITRKNQWQTIKFRGKPLLGYPLEALAESKLDQVIIVLGKDYHRILNSIHIPTPRVRIAMNRRFDRGLSSYLKTALNLISPDTTAVLVARGDFPFLKTSLIDRMIDFFKSDRSGILVPTFEGRDGHPRMFDQRYFQFLMKILGSDVGETVVNKFPNDVFRMDVKNPGVIKDLLSIQELESIDSIEIDRQEKEAHLTDSVIMAQAFEKVEAREKAKTTEFESAKPTTEMEEKLFNTDSIAGFLDSVETPDVSSDAYNISLDTESVEKSLAIPGIPNEKSLAIPEETGSKSLVIPDGKSASDLSLKALNDLMNLQVKPLKKESSTDKEPAKKDMFRRVAEPVKPEPGNAANQQKQEKSLQQRQAELRIQPKDE